MQNRWLVAAGIALGSLLAGSPVDAQRAVAEALFREGRKLMTEGKWAQACEAFEASNHLEPRAGTLLRLGECREQNQQLASAWSAYRDALARVKDPRRRELATAKAAELEPQLSYLTVSVSEESRIEGLTLTCNDEPLDPALWNRALPVDGGDYVIAGRAPGHSGWQTVVHVPVEGGKVSVEVPRLAPLRKLAPTPRALSKLRRLRRLRGATPQSPGPRGCRGERACATPPLAGPGPVAAFATTCHAGSQTALARGQPDPDTTTPRKKAEQTEGSGLLIWSSGPATCAPHTAGAWRPAVGLGCRIGSFHATEATYMSGGFYRRRGDGILTQEQPWWFDDEPREQPGSDARTGGSDGARQALALALGAVTSAHELAARSPIPFTIRSVEILGRLVAALGNAQVTSIAVDLAELQARSQALQQATTCEEADRGKARDALIAGIAALRGKLAALGDADLGAAALDKAQVAAFTAAAYRAINELAPSFQPRTPDIRETSRAAEARTCNLTVLGMALESLGRSAEAYLGNRAALLAAAGVYQHKIFGDGVSSAGFDPAASPGASWRELIRVRFPDFLELAAIANQVKGPPTDETIQVAARIARDALLGWWNLQQLAARFDVGCTIKMFDATGIKTDPQQRTLSDARVLRRYGDDHRIPVEAFIDARWRADASGRKQHRIEAERLQPAYEQAIAGEGIEDRLSLEVYSRHVIEHVGARLDAGGAVIVGLADSSVRLQAVHDDHIVVDDPARASRGATRLSFAEARAMGYFHMRFELS